jgi:hypothetical protein
MEMMERRTPGSMMRGAFGFLLDRIYPNTE